MRRSIVIAGAVAQKPYCGGHSWALLQWALGFRALGWNVFWVDRVDVDSGAAGGASEASRQDVARRYFASVMRGFGLENDCCLLAKNGHGDTSIFGLGRGELRSRLAESELLLNIMGYLRDPELLEAARRRVFLDIDPGFGQMWRELGLADLFAGHDDFVTVGRNVGRPDCPIPDCGLDWIATRPPVVLDLWPERQPGDAVAAFRSVATWRGRYAPIEYGGETYGLRAHEFRRLAELPHRTGLTFELALDIDPADEADRRRLLDGGWQLVDPHEVAATPWRYRRYVADSAAELQVAKQIYVRTASGWFSDRSVCFLASGRPVVMSDTGLAGDLPLGEGLLAYSTPEEAQEAVERVTADLPRHARAARQLAEECFAADLVLPRLLADLGAAAP